MGSEPKPNGDETTDETEECKAERLAIAAAVAPILRSIDLSVIRRRVHLENAEGKVTRITTMGDVLQGLATDHAIAHTVLEKERPDSVFCLNCGRPVSVFGKGHVPKVCREGCPCPTPGCRNRTGRSAASAAVRKGRRGQCLACANRAHAERLQAERLAKTPEERSAISRKASMCLTSEQRLERARKGGQFVQKIHASRTPEERSAISRKANASRTPEQRSAIAQKAAAALTFEQRSKAMRKGQARLTPEQRSEAARKARATRRTQNERAREAKGISLPDSLFSEDEE